MKRRGNRPGSHRVDEPKSEVISQRYTKRERRALELVAGKDGVNEFIRSAALDRAQTMTEQWGAQ